MAHHVQSNLNRPKFYNMRLPLRPLPAYLLTLLIAFAAAQLSAAVLPSGFTVPRPVITTLRFSIENFSFYIAMPPSTQSTCPVR